MTLGGFWGWLVVASLTVGCLSSTEPARFPVEDISVPDESQIYSAEARPEGVTGGPGPKTPGATP